MHKKFKEEIWVPVEGFEQYYEISSHGRGRSISRSKDRRFINKRYLLKPKEKWRGNYVYLSFVFCINKVLHYKIISRLVAKAFVKNTHNYPNVNHKDFDSTNNNALNLEWCTQTQNINHSYINGRYERK